MSNCRSSRFCGVLFLSFAVLLLATVSGQQPLASAEQMAQGTGAVRRPAVKVTGWVCELHATYLLVGDCTLHIDSASSGTDGVQVGDFVSATARVDEDGRLFLRAVDVRPLLQPLNSAIDALNADGPFVSQPLPNQPPDDPLGYPLEFRGVIQEIDPRYWIVGDRMVFVTARTAIEGWPGVGVLAEVKGMLLFQDTILAHSIRIVVPTALQEVEFEGTIDSLSADVWVVGGSVVRIGPRTAVDGTPGVGAIAQVRGILQPDASVIAQRIVVQYPGMSLLAEVEGLVESISSTEWVIAGTPVVLDGGTLVDDSRAPADVGMWALARGYPQLDGSLLAVRIRLSRPD
jgi:hypothetical protein